MLFKNCYISPENYDFDTEIFSGYALICIEEYQKLLLLANRNVEAENIQNLVDSSKIDDLFENTRIWNEDGSKVDGKICEGLEVKSYRCDNCGAYIHCTAFMNEEAYRIVVNSDSNLSHKRCKIVCKNCSEK